ncbi:MAG: hypothetical protein ACOC0G_00605 [Thermodesulfobacteriota bacterium]
MPLLRYLICLTCGLLLGSGCVFADELPRVEKREYLKTTGDKEQLFSWRLENGNGLKLESRIASERDITHMDSALKTQSWSKYDPQKKTDIRVVRKGERLIFSGVFEGKKVARTFEVDESPWYQALSISLHPFAKGGSDGLEFWTVRSDTLDVHRLQVKREKEETLELHGEPVACVKLKIQLTGMKSILWSSYYWLRKSDGLFVRYEGPSGPPGWPETTVELLDHEQGIKPESRAGS